MWFRLLLSLGGAVSGAVVGGVASVYCVNNILSFRLPGDPIVAVIGVLVYTTAGMACVVAGAGGGALVGSMALPMLFGL